MRELSVFQGSKAVILRAEKGSYLVCVDNKIYLIEGECQRVVLSAERQTNFFWHATEAKGQIFAQEYGESPTAIYASEDLVDWERLVTNSSLDGHSRHFHCVSYSPTSNWLLATLGDGCLTRVAFSRDLGRTWNPLLVSPWQFVPATPVDHRVAFGFDSSIVTGGVGIYDFKEEKWDFIFLKWTDRKTKQAQICDLKLTPRGLWIAALGKPQAVVVSRDMRTWYPLAVESFDNEFNHVMLLSVRGDIVLCSTGRSLLFFDGDDFERAMASNPVMTEYNPYWGKLKGYSFLIKHKALEGVQMRRRFLILSRPNIGRIDGS
jgi:hypothetical protein